MMARASMKLEYIYIYIISGQSFYLTTSKSDKIKGSEGGKVNVTSMSIIILPSLLNVPRPLSLSTVNLINGTYWPLNQSFLGASRLKGYCTISSLSLSSLEVNSKLY